MIVLAEPDPVDMVQAIRKAVSLLPKIDPQVMHNRVSELFTVTMVFLSGLFIVTMVFLKLLLLVQWPKKCFCVRLDEETLQLA